MSFGARFVHRLVELRESRGWSQRELGRQSGIHWNTLSRWERGHVARVPAEDVAKVADALGVSIDDLLGRAPSFPVEQAIVRRALDELAAAERHTANLRARLEQLTAS